MSVLSCRETSRRIALGELETAGAWRRLLLRAHMLYCGHCRRFLRELRVLSEAARLWSGALLPPESAASFEKRLLAKLLP